MPEVTIEELTKQLDGLETKVTETLTANSELKSANEKLQETATNALAEIKELKDLNQTLQDQNQAIIDSGTGTSAREEDSEEDEPPTIPEETISAGKKKYKFLVAAFRLAGEPEVIYSSVAAGDDDMIQKILEIEGQSILQEVV